MKARRSVSSFEDIYIKNKNKTGGSSYELKTLKVRDASKEINFP